MSDTIEAKLADLGVHRKNLADDLKILGSVSSVKDLESELGRRHYNCDVDQYLLPMFRPLFLTNPDVRKKVFQEVCEPGISEQIVTAYFTELGNQPYLVFHFRHQEIPMGSREKFIQAADNTMLKLLKEYLGLPH